MYLQEKFKRRTWNVRAIEGHPAAAVAKAKSVSDQAERTELYRKAQAVFKDQAPWFTIAHAVQLKPVRKEVADFKLSPFGRHTFYGVDLKP